MVINQDFILITSLKVKRYTVLCSYSNQIEAVRHVAVAISLDHAVYITVSHDHYNNTDGKFYDHVRIVLLELQEGT